MGYEDQLDDNRDEHSVPTARPVLYGPQGADDAMLLRGQDQTSARWDIFWLILWAGSTYLLMSLVVGLFILPPDTGDASSDTGDVSSRLNLGFTLVWGLLTMAGAMMIARLREQPLSSLGLTSHLWPLKGLLGIPGVLGAWASLLLVYLVFSLVAPEWAEGLVKNRERIMEHVPRLQPVTLCGVFLVVGVYEEVIFRGFLLTRLRRATGSVAAAVLLSAFLFAAPHMPTQQAITVVPLFLIGVLWGGLTWWQRSLVPAIVAHVVFNLAQILILFYGPIEPGGTAA
jgi:membrane protease YdiL (CAAX protease family)